MLNLLPQKQKILLQKEYSGRRMIVWLGSIALALVISLILLSPSYFLTRIRAEEARGELESAKRALDAELPPKEMLAEFQAAVRNAEALKPLTKSLSVYELVKLFEARPKTIRITGISFSEQAEGRPTIVVNGRAENRDGLTAFGRALEERVEFATVNLPVSNFVKEKDIDFSMTVVLK